MFTAPPRTKRRTRERVTVEGGQVVGVDFTVPPDALLDEGPAQPLLANFCQQLTDGARPETMQALYVAAEFQVCDNRGDDGAQRL